MWRRHMSESARRTIDATAMQKAWWRGHNRRAGGWAEEEEEAEIEGKSVEGRPPPGHKAAASPVI